MPAKKKTTVSKRSTARCQHRAVSTAYGTMNFSALVDSIRQVHEQSAAIVNRAVCCGVSRDLAVGDRQIGASDPAQSKLEKFLHARHLEMLGEA